MRDYSDSGYLENQRAAHRKRSPEAKTKWIQKISEAQQGDKGNGWKGDFIGSRTAHYRADGALPLSCHFADDTCKGQLQVAFRWDTPKERVQVDGRGSLFSVQSGDYIRLCKSHHLRYDR